MEALDAPYKYALIRNSLIELVDAEERKSHKLTHRKVAKFSKNFDRSSEGCPKTNAAQVARKALGVPRGVPSKSLHLDISRSPAPQKCLIRSTCRPSPFPQVRDPKKQARLLHSHSVPPELRASKVTRSNLSNALTCLKKSLATNNA